MLNPQYRSIGEAVNDVLDNQFDDLAHSNHDTIEIDDVQELESDAARKFLTENFDDIAELFNDPWSPDNDISRKDLEKLGDLAHQMDLDQTHFAGAQEFVEKNEKDLDVDSDGIISDEEIKAYSVNNEVSEHDQAAFGYLKSRVLSNYKRENDPGYRSDRSGPFATGLNIEEFGKMTLTKRLKRTQKEFVLESMIDRNMLNGAMVGSIIGGGLGYFGPLAGAIGSGAGGFLGGAAGYDIGMKKADNYYEKYHRDGLERMFG